MTLSPRLKRYCLRFLVVVGALVAGVFIYGIIASQLLGPEGESETLRVEKRAPRDAEAVLMRDVLAEHCAPLLDALQTAESGRTGFVNGPDALDTEKCLREHYDLDLPATIVFESETFFIYWQQSGPY